MHAARWLFCAPRGTASPHRQPPMHPLNLPIQLCHPRPHGHTLRCSLDATSARAASRLARADKGHRNLRTVIESPQVHLKEQVFCMSPGRFRKHRR